MLVGDRPVERYEDIMKFISNETTLYKNYGTSLILYELGEDRYFHWGRASNTFSYNTGNSSAHLKWKIDLDSPMDEEIMNILEKFILMDELK